MTAARRWGIVAAGLMVLVATPFLVAAWPVPQADITAAALLARVRAAQDVAFDGRVEVEGHVALPPQAELGSLTGLLGGRTELRVWWADPGTWRTATLRPTGETDLYHRNRSDGRGQSLRWVYESKRVTSYPDPPVRLPLAGDLLPNVLAGHVLEDARPDELTRLPDLRVAGRTALGLRLVPADPESSLAAVDVHADAATGLPLAVELHVRGSDAPTVTTRFTDVSIGQPPADTLRFHPPADASLRTDDLIDLAAAADRYAELSAPRSLLGFDRRATTDAVGVYGRGPTVLLAVPLWERYSEQLRGQLARRPGAQHLPQGELVTAGPLTLLLGVRRNDRAWLVAGTITAAAAVAAAEELEQRVPASGGSSGGNGGPS
jgi:outer membrane lipoprotein-sorting protein